MRWPLALLASSAWLLLCVGWVLLALGWYGVVTGGSLWMLAVLVPLTVVYRAATSMVNVRLTWAVQP